MFETDHIMHIMWLKHCFSFLQNQMHIFHPTLMLPAGGNDINTRGIDAAMPQNVCQLGDIPFHAVKGSCKQMSKIVRKDLLGTNLCKTAQALHFLPDVASVHWISLLGNKDRT